MANPHVCPLLYEMYTMSSFRRTLRRYLRYELFSAMRKVDLQFSMILLVTVRRYNHRGGTCEMRPGGFGSAQLALTVCVRTWLLAGCDFFRGLQRPGGGLGAQRPSLRWVTVHLPRLAPQYPPHHVPNAPFCCATDHATPPPQLTTTNPHLTVPHHNYPHSWHITPVHSWTCGLQRTVSIPTTTPTTPPIPVVCLSGVELVWEHVGLRGVKTQSKSLMVMFWVLSTFLPIFIVAVTIESLSASQVC